MIPVVDDREVNMAFEEFTRACSPGPCSPNESESESADVAGSDVSDPNEPKDALEAHVESNKIGQRSRTSRVSAWRSWPRTFESALGCRRHPGGGIPKARKTMRKH